MPRRADDVSSITVACTGLEQDVISTMMAASGCGSACNLVRIALWSLADHMGLDVPNHAFDMRLYHGSRGRPGAVRTKPNPKVRQDRPWKQPKPGKSHPWRGEGKPVPPTPPDDALTCAPCEDRDVSGKVTP